MMIFSSGFSIHSFMAVVQTTRRTITPISTGVMLAFMATACHAELNIKEDKKGNDSTGLAEVSQDSIAAFYKRYQNSENSYDTRSSRQYSGSTPFLQALNAANAKDNAALSQYASQLRQDKFAMYPDYWRLNQDLASRSPQEIQQFARQYFSSVMAEKLAADYAEEKASVSDYAAVRQITPLITNADEREACAIALGQNSSRNADNISIMQAKSKVWLNTLSQPDLCDKLAKELKHNAIITNTDRQQRLYRVIRSNNQDEVVQLARQLGIPLEYSDLSQISRNPNQEIRRLAANRSAQPAAQMRYLYAIARLADKSGDEAAVQVTYDAQHNTSWLQPSTLKHGYRIAATMRTNNNNSQGFIQAPIQWFAASIGEPFNQEEAINYARLSVRYGQWQDVIRAIGAMPYDLQQDNGWQYWLARAYSQVGNTSQKSISQRLFKSLAQNDDYYGLLAAARIGQSPQRQPDYQPSTQDYQRLAQDPYFARAFALYQMNAPRQYVNREWNWAVRQARLRGDNALVVTAAAQAHAQNWLDRAIYALENIDGAYNLGLNFPTPHQQDVIYYSRKVGIDPAWAYGIIRQESRFVTTARSHAGASGLMQIMPATGRLIARKLGERYSASRTNQKNTNIRYGTFYMADILQDLSYQPVLATAGYNAGPNRAKRWRPEWQSIPADQYVESIPFGETRDYVKQVMRNATYYNLRLNSSRQNILERMGTVAPKV